MLPGIFKDSRGYTLVELLVAIAIFVLVATGMGSLYVSMQHAFDFSSAQAFVQRQGTLIQEELMREMLPAVSVQVMACGPAGAAPTLLYQLTAEAAERDVTTPKARFRCLYRRQESGDTVPKLYTCKLPDNPPTYSDPVPAGADCSSGTKVNLLKQELSQTTVQLGAPLTVNNVTFTQLTTIGSPPMTVTVPTVDIRFDLTDQKSLFDTQAGQTGLRFGFVIAAKN